MPFIKNIQYFINFGAFFKIAHVVTISVDLLFETVHAFLIPKNIFNTT